jgi:hypothetical protein
MHVEVHRLYHMTKMKRQEMQYQILGYRDSNDFDQDEPCHRRIYARYGLFRLILLMKYII